MGNIKTVFNKNLVSYQKSTLGFSLMAVAFIFLPWLNQGVIDQTLTIFGILWLQIAVMRAKGANTVIGGLCTAFIALSYMSVIGGIISIIYLFPLTLGLTALFFILEMGFFKFGPTTQKSDAFQIVPMAIMSFILITGLLGYNSLFVFNMNDIMGAINYLGLLFFSVLTMLDVAGWKIMGKKTNLWITIFALAVVATAFMDAYGISLFRWG